MPAEETLVPESGQALAVPGCGGAGVVSYGVFGHPPRTLERMEPQLARKLLSRTRRFERDRRWKKARRVMRRLVKAEPDNPQYCIRYARLLTKCGDWSKARKFVRRALKADEALGSEPWVRRFSVAVERIARPGQRHLELLSRELGRTLEPGELDGAIIQKGINNSGGLISWEVPGEGDEAPPAAAMIEKIFIHPRDLAPGSAPSREAIFARHARLTEGAETLRLPRILGTDADQGWTGLFIENLRLSGGYQRSFPGILEEHDAPERIGRAAAEFNALLRLEGLDEAERQRLVRQPNWTQPSAERARQWTRRFYGSGLDDATRARLLDAVTPLLDWHSRKQKTGFRLSPETVVHGDLVPNNLFLEPEGRVVPIDFEFLRYGPVGFDPARFSANVMVKVIEKHEARKAARWDRAQEFLTRLTAAYVDRYGELRPNEFKSADLWARIDFLFRLRTAHELCRRGGSRVFNRSHQAALLPRLLAPGFLSPE